MREEEKGWMERRSFVFGTTAVAALAATPRWAFGEQGVRVDVAAIDRQRILAAADRYMKEQPKTVTSASSPRSSGGPHDFFSEGDYWWPNPKDPNGPYIRRDGESNPDNFVGHREVLLRMSVQMPALTAAWVETRRKPYAQKAADHLRAWFLDPATRMNPNLEYAQAIHGVTPGRGTGIIDTLHLVEPARAAMWLEHSGALTAVEVQGIKEWFRQYVTWMNESKNGKEERAAKNNHGTTWVTQVASFAALVGDARMLDECRERFRSVLIPNQVAADGRLPLELARTKPYSYCLFDMDALATICQICSKAGDDLWSFTTADGRGMAKVIAFMAPFIADKSKWPFPHDVEYWDDLPVRQPSLLFGGLAYENSEYIALWKKLNPDPAVPEIIRNFPVRQPLLWVRQPA
jgi:hypothetical protein